MHNWLHNAEYLRFFSTIKFRYGYLATPEIVDFFRTKFSCCRLRNLQSFQKLCKLYDAISSAMYESHT